MKEKKEGNLQKDPLQTIATIKKLDLDPYNELIQSLPAKVRKDIISELDYRLVVQRAELLCKELLENVIVGVNLEESRTLFLAALRNLRDKKISVNQLATLHLLDSAIRTLYVSPMIYFIHKYVDGDGNLARTVNLFALTNLRGMPTSVKRYTYNTVVIPKEGMSFSDMPWRMQKPLMLRFFNFNKAEWDQFCNEMAQAPVTEQFFYVLVAPEEGCWSSIIANIQKVIKCMRVLDWLVESKDAGLIEEKIMLVPSFTMFQAAINAKAKTLGREPVELIPTYGYIEAEHYTNLKSFGKIAMSMYLPEESIYKRYNDSQGEFRSKIDGHPMETAFAGAIHDVYHAMREMAMSENVAKARMRLAFIAKHHPKNKLNSESRSVDEILVDGELIHSYSAEVDTIFDPEYRPAQAQSFGDLFYSTSLKFALHEDLKRAFIEDMVVNKEEWQSQYQLSKADLREDDQKIFDEIESQQLNKFENDKKISFSVIPAMNKFGFLGINSQKSSDLDSSVNNEFKFA